MHLSSHIAYVFFYFHYLSCEVFEFGIYAFLVFILQFYNPSLEGDLGDLRDWFFSIRKAKEEASREQDITTSKQRKNRRTKGAAPAAFPPAPAGAPYSANTNFVWRFYYYYIIIISLGFCMTLFRLFSAMWEREEGYAIWETIERWALLWLWVAKLIVLHVIRRHGWMNYEDLISISYLWVIYHLFLIDIYLCSFLCLITMLGMTSMLWICCWFLDSK